MQILPPGNVDVESQNLEIRLKHLYRDGNYNRNYGDEPGYLLPLHFLLRLVKKGLDNDLGAIPEKKLLKTQGKGPGPGVASGSSFKKKRTKW